MTTRYWVDRLKPYRPKAEKMLKSEALVTLSLKASFEATSAPTLHDKSNDGHLDF